ncbi:MDR family MFS transporter [Anaerotardibacter muris]|uniref:MDR family MFS transporter n=1 Tax=Anaerotardibacter muris TaxID=2941505 RepID=UPI00203E72B1|nr:MDR family MFS transporter [Anaerotardibacter muris]
MSNEPAGSATASAQNSTEAQDPASVQGSETLEQPGIPAAPKNAKVNKLGITHKQTVMIMLLLFGTFVTVLNQTVVAPALPSIMVDMNINAATGQWLTTGFTLVNAIMVPVTAYLIDRFPIRNLFLFSMSVFAIGSLMAAWGPNFPVLLGGRIVQAIGAGVLMPMVMTVLMLTFPLEKRGFAMGLFGIVMAFGPAIGPTAAGVIIDAADWHIMFYVVTILAAIVAVATPFTMEKIEPKSKDLHLDIPSVIMSTIGFGSLLYSFSIVGNGGFGIEFAVSFILGAVFIVLFFKRQLSMEHPMLRVRVLENKTFLMGTIIGMVVQAALLSVGILLPIYLQSLLGYSATESGLVLLPGALIMGIMGPIAGRWFDRHGPRTLAIVGTLMLTLGTVFLAFLGPEVSLVYVAVVMAVRLFGMALINMTITTWAMNALGDDLINHGTSVNNTFRQIAGSLGTAILTSVFAMVSVALIPSEGNTLAGVHGVDAAFGVSAVLCAIGFVLVLIFVKDGSSAAQVDLKSHDRTVLESIMKSDVFTIPATSSVLDVMRILVDKQISAAPVVDGEGRAVGFVSDGDIMRFLSKRSHLYTDPIVMIMQASPDNDSFDEKLAALMRMNVMDVATKGVIGISLYAKLPEVCRVLGDNHLKKVPVLDDGKIVGVVNRSDITHYAMRNYITAQDHLV